MRDRPFLLSLWLISLALFAAVVLKLCARNNSPAPDANTPSDTARVPAQTQVQDQPGADHEEWHVFGTVTSSSHAAGVSGARICMMQVGPIAVSDAQGRYRAVRRGPRPRQGTEIWVEMPDWEVRPSIRLDVRMFPESVGASFEFHFRLNDLIKVHGAVRDSSGNPIEGVRVVAIWVDGDDISGGRCRATTDSEGRYDFFLQGAVGRSATLVAHKERFYMLQDAGIRFECTGSEKVCDIILEQKTYVRVVVQNTSNAFVPAATVTYSYDYDKPPGRVHGQRQTDTDGGAEIPVYTGRLHLTVVARGYRRATLEGPFLQIGQPVGGELVLRVPDGMSINGIIRPAAGGPVSSSRIKFHVLRAKCTGFLPNVVGPLVDEEVVTDDDGRFTVTSLTPGLWYLPEILQATSAHDDHGSYGREFQATESLIQVVVDR